MALLLGGYLVFTCWCYLSCWNAAAGLLQNIPQEFLRIKIYGSTFESEGNTVSGTFSIIDSNGNTLGLCGICIPMENWQKTLLSVEKQYKVKINLIDTDGLVQIDTDFNNINNA